MNSSVAASLLFSGVLNRPNSSLFTINAWPLEAPCLPVNKNVASARIWVVLSAVWHKLSEVQTAKTVWIQCKCEEGCSNCLDSLEHGWAVNSHLFKGALIIMLHCLPGGGSRPATCLPTTLCWHWSSPPSLYSSSFFPLHPPPGCGGGVVVCGGGVVGCGGVWRCALLIYSLLICHPAGGEDRSIRLTFGAMWTLSPLLVTGLSSKRHTTWLFLFIYFDYYYYYYCCCCCCC